MWVAHKINAMDLTDVTEDKRSEIFDIRHLTSFSVHVIWTSTTSSATVKIEVSNNKDESTWAELSTTESISNNTGNKILEFNNASYAYMRIFLDHSSGTVTSFKAHVCIKGAQ